MIAKLKGTVDSVGEDWAVVDVAGVGYLVSCSNRTLGQLAVGEAAALHVETQVREDAIQLFGFLETLERDWFRLLTQVQGVGARVGLALLSTLTPDQLTHAIASNDKAAITRAPGVGPKLATRILSELKDKVAGLALGPAAAKPGAPAPVAAPAGATSEAVSALVNLGFNPTQALTAVSGAAGKLGDGAGVEDLIRDALADLQPLEARR